jgi:CIC family chloride channel protein
LRPRLIVRTLCTKSRKMPPLSFSSSPDGNGATRQLGSVVRWFRWPTAPLLGSNGFESTRYLTKWLLLGTLIGLVAGLGAIVFFVAIDQATHLFLGTFVGYLPPSPVGEGQPVIRQMERPWLLPLVVGLGGLLSGLMVFTFAPEAEGHGTDAAIAAIHHHQGRVRARIPPIKLLASAITIGSGGSGGREGPAAQISAGFGSLLGQWLNLKPADRRIAVAAGMGAGIGAIFRAPLGGALMGAEILYLHDLEVEAIIPALIASIVGYTVYGAYFGFAPIFGAQPELALGAPIQLVYYALLGVFAGLGGILYARTFYGATGVFHRLHLPVWLKPMLGGALVGGLALLVPGALHMGYGWVQIGMSPDLLNLPLWMVLVLPFAKILSTSLSIGSGGSGGIFGPGMVIGGMLGATFWRLFHDVLPGMPQTPAAFVIVGMMALFGGIAHAPLAVMLMVAEMTGNLSMLAPAMVAVGVSTALVGDNTIYRNQLTSRASSPAHRARFSFPLLSALVVRDAMTPARIPIRVHATVQEALSLLAEQGARVLAAIDDQNLFAGVLTRARLEAVSHDVRTSTSVSDLVNHTVAPLRPTEFLVGALEHLSDCGLQWLPVVTEHRIVGGLGVRDILRAYNSAVELGFRRVQSLPEGSSLFELHLRAESKYAGCSLREADLPQNMLIVSIKRGDDTIFPTASTRLEPDDTLTIMADPAVETQVHELFEGLAG